MGKHNNNKYKTVNNGHRRFGGRRLRFGKIQFFAHYYPLVLQCMELQ